jgi:uncharacterized linocin/CFP29 family protein
MEFLSRTTSPVTGDLWRQIDEVTVSAARNVLIGRRVLTLTGPLGAGTGSVPIDDYDQKAEVASEGYIVTRGRKIVELPTLYEDFTLYARDLAQSEKAGSPTDLTAVRAAAQAVALTEDRLVFLGNAKLGYDGLLSVRGAHKLAKADWSSGENAFTDVAAGVEALVSKGVYGAYTLVVSPALYLQMQRLQQALGLLEIDRVSKLVDGRLFKSPVLGKNQAVLVCAQPENMDLAVGQDLAAAYLEQREMNHFFRLTESVLPRIRRPQAVVVFDKA